MQKSIALVVGIALVLLLGVVYVLSNNQKQVAQEDVKQLTVETHDFKKVLAYENDYMGNNSNITNLFNKLPLFDHREVIELDPDTFTFIVNYKINSDQKTVVYNATAAFVLIKNLQVIDMRFSDQSYVITRENVERWFGDEFESLLDPVVFKEKVHEPLLKSKTKDWFNYYTK